LRLTDQPNNQWTIKLTVAVYLELGPVCKRLTFAWFETNIVSPTAVIKFKHLLRTRVNGNQFQIWYILNVAFQNLLVSGKVSHTVEAMWGSFFFVRNQRPQEIAHAKYNTQRMWHVKCSRCSYCPMAYIYMYKLHTVRNHSLKQSNGILRG
jgi:hypothetical protein